MAFESRTMSRASCLRWWSAAVTGRIFVRSAEASVVSMRTSAPPGWTSRSRACRLLIHRVCSATRSSRRSVSSRMIVWWSSAFTRLSRRLCDATVATEMARGVGDNRSSPEAYSFVTASLDFRSSKCISWTVSSRPPPMDQPTVRSRRGSLQAAAPTPTSCLGPTARTRTPCRHHRGRPSPGHPPT